MKTRETSLSLDIIPGLIRNNIFSFVLIIGFVYLIDYSGIFVGSNEIYYVIFTALALFAIAITIHKYKNPLRYQPRYVSFVKDRNDPMVKMEPFMDPLITKLGLVKPEEFVNVRYAMYPDLGTGIDLDPNTGIITGFPMEPGNHTSEIKMKYLGGQYSAKVRVKVSDTLRSKTSSVSDELAPPRTVAQLLVREEDIKIREKELSSTIDERIRDLEREYKVKESSLEKRLKSEEETHLKTLSATRRTHEKELKDKGDSHEKELKDRDDKIDKLEAEMTRALQDKERELIDIENKMKEKLEQSKEKADELELLSLETGAAAADLEKELLEILENMSAASEEEIADTESFGSLKKIEGELRDLKPRFQEAIKSGDEEAINEMRPILEGLISQREDFLDKDSEPVEEEPVEEEPEEEVVEEEEPEEELVEEEPEEANYDSMTVPQLKKLLKEKGLPVSGKKEELIARLRELSK